MRRAVAAAFPWAATALFAVGFLVWEGSGGGRLLDPDTWMHLAFVRENLAHGSLTHYTFMRDGAPGGMQVMWTLPYDAAIAAMAAPFAPFTGWDRALALAAPILGPFWLCAASFSVGRLCWSLGARRLAPWAALAASAAPALQAYLQVGRVSHHGMTVALATLAMAAAVRFARRPARREAAWTALWCTMACWQSMETLPAVLAAWAVVVAACALRRRAHKGAAAFAVAMTVLPVMAIACDPDPVGWLALSADRFSLFHVATLAVLGACAPLAAAAAARWGGAGTWRRLAVAAAAVLAVLLPCSVLAAAAVPWPVNTSDPYVDALLWQQDTENLSVLQSGGGLLLFAFPTAVGMAWLLAGAWRRRRQPALFPWMLAAALLACEVGIGLASIRLATYAAALSSVPAAAAIYALVRRCMPGADEAGRRTVVFGAAAAAGAWMLFSSAATPDAGIPPSGDACPVAPAAAAIEEALPPGSIVAAEIWASPELVWTTRSLRTIAGPYHRNLSGLGDLGRIFISTDQDLVRRTLQRRGAAAVLACGLAERTDMGIFKPGSLQRMIVDGHPPVWLQPVPLPAAAGGLRLFKVLEDGDGHADGHP